MYHSLCLNHFETHHHVRVYDSKALWGYCYTQFTDVEQEINGLLTYERKPKCDMAEIKKINDGYHITMVE